MRAVVLVVVFLLAAYSTTPAPVATVSPTPSAPSPSGTPSPVALNLSCRLPVTWAVQSGQSTRAGFVSFPGPALLEDPDAPAHSVFYDRGLAKWLPVPRTSVSPDGKRYAYGEGNAYLSAGGKLHVVDVATGVDTVIYSGGRLYKVVDFAAEGIYVTAAVPEGYSRGLWLQNPAGGPARQISSTIVAPVIGGGAAWGLDFNAADPSPGPGGMEGPKNEILRFDLSSGAATVWFYRPGATIYVLGFDAYGRQFVSADFPPAPTDVNGRNIAELWQVASATSATMLFSGAGVPSPSRMAAVDSHGVWFDGGDGLAGTVWLLAGASIQLLATLNVSYFAVAGGCID
jgi:hypothetical protein